MSFNKFRFNINIKNIYNLIVNKMVFNILKNSLEKAITDNKKQELERKW